MSAEYIAHVKQDATSGEWETHLLEDHLKKVAALSGDFADIFQAGEWAELAGLWHDLGKYSDDFQNMIKKRSGYDLTAHMEDYPGKVNHSSAGALHAVKLLEKPQGLLFAYLIAGHHGGLPDWFGGLDRRLDLQQSENPLLYQKALKAVIPDFILKPDHIAQPLLYPQFSKEKMAYSFWLRLLFSCLVDGDFLDTEEFMTPDKKDLRGQYPSLSTIKTVFDVYLYNKTQEAEDSLVNRIRKEVLEASLAKAGNRQGIYKLTVPTGGGKTLTSVAFGLAHAKHHGARIKRIIYVLPYTSILEQTAQVLREALSGLDEACLIEHHSLADPTKESVESRLAAENWDAPIILTTNVQFFESLFANRTSRCRKLHRICNSIIILDEIQQIPPDFKKPIEQALRLLVESYGVTVLLSTATQPALDLPIQDELAPDINKLFQALKRVNIVFPTPEQMKEPVSWGALAKELSDQEEVLCIVNRRDDARQLWALMPTETIHLSARMCPAHRSDVIKALKEQLRQNKSQAIKTPLRVISTQIVEAGVDIDFPIVYRALSGLDSIAQAAGRCNREGTLSKNGVFIPGHVQVFIPPEGKLPDTLKLAAATTREFLSFHGSVRDLTPEMFTQYFEHFYSGRRTLDKYDIIKALSPDGGPYFQFKEAAEYFKLIDEKDQRSVFIPYDNNAKSLIETLRFKGRSRLLFRGLQRYMINIHVREFETLLKEGVIKEVKDSGIFELLSTLHYDDRLGLKSKFTVEAGDLII